MKGINLIISSCGRFVLAVLALANACAETYQDGRGKK